MLALVEVQLPVVEMGVQQLWLHLLLVDAWGILQVGGAILLLLLLVIQLDRGPVIEEILLGLLLKIGRGVRVRGEENGAILLNLYLPSVNPALCWHLIRHQEISLLGHI